MNVFGYNVTDTFVYSVIIAVVFLIGLILFVNSATRPEMTVAEYEEANMHRTISYILLIVAIAFGAGLAYTHKKDLIVLTGQMCGTCGGGSSVEGSGMCN